MSDRLRRRSATVNFATVHLLPRARLIAELSERGVSTAGSKDVLADRLADVLQAEASTQSKNITKKEEVPQSKTPRNTREPRIKKRSFNFTNDEKQHDGIKKDVVDVDSDLQSNKDEIIVDAPLIPSVQKKQVIKEEVGIEEHNTKKEDKNGKAKIEDVIAGEAIKATDTMTLQIPEKKEKPAQTKNPMKRHFTRRSGKMKHSDEEESQDIVSPGTQKQNEKKTKEAVKVHKKVNRPKSPASKRPVNNLPDLWVKRSAEIRSQQKLEHERLQELEKARAEEEERKRLENLEAVRQAEKKIREELEAEAAKVRAAEAERAAKEKERKKSLLGDNHEPSTAQIPLSAIVLPPPPPMPKLALDDAEQTVQKELTIDTNVSAAAGCKTSPSSPLKDDDKYSKPCKIRVIPMELISTPETSFNENVENVDVTPLNTDEEVPQMDEKVEIESIEQVLISKEVENMEPQDDPPEPVAIIVDVPDPTEAEKEKERVREILADQSTRLDILEKARTLLSGIGADGRYGQEQPDENCTMSTEEPEKELDFHGEPVPSDDEALFVAAAGVPNAKKKKKRMEEEEEEVPSMNLVQLDYYNADLHVKCEVEKDTSRWWIINPDNSDGLAIMWGGVKTTFGLMLPCLLDFPSQINSETPNSDNPPRKLVFQAKLGESKNSWCVTSGGLKGNDCLFTPYLDTEFGVGDVITAIYDIDKDEISFNLNGKPFPPAFVSSFSDGDVVFPTISTKNCKIAVNIGEWPDASNYEEFWGTREDSWTFLTELPNCTLKRAQLPPPKEDPVFMLMTVGLPASGKTTYVKQYMRDHPEERLKLISADTILNQMRIDGVPRSRVRLFRWDMIMGLAAKAVNRYIALACRRRRNYIIDGTNCSTEARKRKMANFKEYYRKCLLFIPSDEEWKIRLDKQARNENVVLPQQTLLGFKAEFSIPSAESEGWDEVIFVEPSAEFVHDACALVEKYNLEAAPFNTSRHGRKRARPFGSSGGPPPKQPFPENNSIDSFKMPAPPALEIRWLDTTETEQNQLNSNSSPVKDLKDGIQLSTGATISPSGNQPHQTPKTPGSATLPQHFKSSLNDEKKA